MCRSAFLMVKKLFEFILNFLWQAQSRKLLTNLMEAVQNFRYLFGDGFSSRTHFVKEPLLYTKFFCQNIQH